MPDIRRGQEWWNCENRTDRLRELWQAGKTAIAIAAELDITKSAVIGKLHRSGLAERSQAGLGKYQAGHAQPKPQTMIERLDEVEKLMPKGNCCRYPYGDPGKSSFRFCGNTALDGRPYCDEHQQRCVQRISVAP